MSQRQSTDSGGHSQATMAHKNVGFENLPSEIVGHILDHVLAPADFASCMLTSSVMHAWTVERGALHTYDLRTDGEVITSGLRLEVIKAVYKRFAVEHPMTADRILSAAGRADAAVIAWACDVYGRRVAGDGMEECLRSYDPSVPFPLWRASATPKLPLSSRARTLSDIAYKAIDLGDDALALWAYALCASMGGDPVATCMGWCIDHSKRFLLSDLATKAAVAGRAGLVLALMPHGSPDDFGRAAVELAGSGPADAFQRMANAGMLDGSWEPESNRVYYPVTAARAAAVRATDRGRLDILRVLDDRYGRSVIDDDGADHHGSTFNWEDVGRPLLVVAARNGHMDVVEWLYDRCRLERHYVVIGAIRMAGVHGRTHIVRWLLGRAIADDRAPTHTADAALCALFRSIGYCANKTCDRQAIIDEACAVLDIVVASRRDRIEHAPTDVKSVEKRMPMSLASAIGAAFVSDPDVLMLLEHLSVDVLHDSALVLAVGESISNLKTAYDPNRAIIRRACRMFGGELVKATVAECTCARKHDCWKRAFAAMIAALPPNTCVARWIEAGLECKFRRENPWDCLRSSGRATPPSWCRCECTHCVVSFSSPS